MKNLLFVLLWLIKCYQIRSEIYSESPDVKPSATRGLVIDAGSGGSRLHVYSWKQRIFNTVPPPISYPEANEKWTARIDPGISSYGDSPELVRNHLAPLIDFAVLTLQGLEKEFSNYPIYFKATGGMRELELQKREDIIKFVRIYLSDKSFCPFFFRDDFARVISGEEEAIFSWAATNFLMGNLLPASQGTGSVVDMDLNTSYGTLDLGGSSTQIAFFVPSQDLLEGLFKLQIGGHKHWNVYTKSFLQFGIVSARKRYLINIVDKYFLDNKTVQSITLKGSDNKTIDTSNSNSNNKNRKNNNKNPVYSISSPSVVNYCFHSGYSEKGSNSAGDKMVDISGPTNPVKNQMELCKESLKPLMEKKYGIFCNNVYHGDCSIAGAYQPPIPEGKHGNFIGTSSYKYAWKFLLLSQTSSLETVESKTKYICNMTFSDINNYYNKNNLNFEKDKLVEFLPYYCFLSSYILVLLQDGYGFKKNQTITVLDEVKGNKVGWALGAILYEINTLPWKLETPAISQNMLFPIVLAIIIGFISGYVISFQLYNQKLIKLQQQLENDDNDYDANFHDDILNEKNHGVIEMKNGDNSNINNTNIIITTFNNMLNYNHPYTKIADP